MHLENYDNITIAGFHALHRRMWNEIAVQTIKNKPYSKEQFIKDNNLLHIPYNCFACLVSVGKIVTNYTVDDPFDCDLCPVNKWFNPGKSVPCVNDIKYRTPDDYAVNESVLDLMIEQSLYEISKYAEYIRDLEWEYETHEILEGDWRFSNIVVLE